MDYQDIIYEKEGRIAILTLNRPEVMNSYTRKMVREMADALDDAANDDEIRGLIITANGRGFCTGVNNKDTEAERKPMRWMPRQVFQC